MNRPLTNTSSSRFPNWAELISQSQQEMSSPLMNLQSFLNTNTQANMLQLMSSVFAPPPPPPQEVPLFTPNSNILQTLLCQQIANNMNRVNVQTALFNLQQLAQQTNQRKRTYSQMEGMQALAVGNEEKHEVIKNHFYNSLDKILKEEFSDSEGSPRISEPIDAVVEEERPPSPPLSVEIEAQDEQPAIRKNSEAPSSPDADSIATLSPLSASTPTGPLSPGLVEKIHSVAQSMTNVITASSDDLEEKLPPLWKGRIIKNSSECTVQMHHLSGQEDYIRNALATLERDSENRDPALKLVQKMNVKGNAIYRLLVRLQDSEKSSTCLCIPCGNTVEEMRHHARVMKGDFVDYFQRKQCAGIAQMDSCTPASHIYVFGPNEFTDEYMKVASPKILERLQRKMADDFYYLFVAIAPIQPAPVSQD